MSAGGGSSAEPDGAGAPDGTGRGRWLSDHSGRLAGAGLGLLGFSATVFLAAIGFKPAFFLVVLLVAGVLTIAVGGRIRGS